MGGEVSEETARKRYAALRTVALGSSYLYRSGFLMKEVKVLVESKRDRQSGLLTGYSDNYIKVLFNGDDALMRTIVPVRIEGLNLMYTQGIYEPK